MIDSSMLGRREAARVRTLRAVEHVIEKCECNARISVGLVRDRMNDGIGDSFLW